MKRIVVVAFSPGLASSLAITQDIFATANRLALAGGRSAPFEVLVISPAAARSCVFEADDLLLLPGLGIPDEEELATWLSSRGATAATRFIEQAHAAGATVAASCASTFLLAKAGILDGRLATTTWWLAPLFRRLFPKVDLNPERILVADWPIATAGAALAQVDLVLAIVAKFASPGLSRACARYLLLDERKSQGPYMAVGHLAVQDACLSRAEAWIQENLANDFTIDQVADSAGMAPRTFARRVHSVAGMSPVKFVQRVRMEAAERLLETTRLTVDEVAREVGYAESSTLRRLIRREGRRAPGDLRRHR